MFNRDKVLSDLYNSREIETALSKWEPAELREDLKQEVFIVLCALTPDKLQGMIERKQINWFIVGVMQNMIASDRSTFYNTHRWREKMLSDPRVNELGEIILPLNNTLIVHIEEDGRKWVEEVSEALKTLDPYEEGLFTLYTELGASCKPVAEKTTIPERAVRFAVSKARIKLKQHLRK